ncbi:MAG TPA: hypothetical protein VNZ63_02190 [Verrucomicrobiae bacterium]|jgi:hypothetical protein|nr:hypothetical protein [Verrucomicrobiae bacterium]
MADPHNPSAATPGYETRDADASGVLKFLLVLGVALVIVSIVCYGLFRYYSSHAQNQAATESPFADQRQLPLGPQLQVNPREDWLKFREEQQKSLEAPLAWENQSAGTVRVPIQEAMDLLVKKGLPVQGETQAAPAVAKSAASEGNKKP